MRIRIEVDKAIRIWIEELKPGNPADPEEHYHWEIGPNLISRNQEIIAQKIDEYSEVYDQAYNAVVGHITEIIKNKIEKELKMLEEQQNEP